MKRYLINGLKLYYTDVATARSKHPGSEVEEIDDTEHLPYIDLLMEQSSGEIMTMKRKSSDIRYCFKAETPFGICEIVLSKDENDGHFYDFCQYRLHERGKLQIPVLWTISSPKSAYYELFTGKTGYFVLEIGKKPTKPKELKGMKPIGTVSFLNRAACQFFVVGDDLFVKHTDYFSPSYHRDEDISTPLEYRARKYGISEKKNKFVYADCWGDIVTRQVAWLKITNIMPLVRRMNHVQVSMEICRLMCEYHGFNQLNDPEWQRFWERAAVMLRTKQEKEG